LFVTLNVNKYQTLKMCQKCVKEEYPDRGSTCLEEGSYYQNFSRCAECQGQDVLQVENKSIVEDVDGVETVSYDHICRICRHVVASHSCTFKIEDSYQEYEMSCLLCGSSEDSRSILPCDPRHQSQFF